MKFLLPLILTSLALALVISPAPGIDIEIYNKTTLTIATDVGLKIIVNNTYLSLKYGVDVYTIAIVHFKFQCSTMGEKSAVYIMQLPVAVQDISFARETGNLCEGEETRITDVNASFIVLSRGGIYISSYYIDIGRAARGAGLEMRYVPEWRTVSFKITTSLIDRCNWVQYNLKGRYGGDIGTIKIISHDCFNQSKALRIAYQPYYHYMIKYIKVVVSLSIGNITLSRDLSGGGEVVIPGPYALYGTVKNFTITLLGPQDSYILYPLNLTGQITIIPPVMEIRGISGLVAKVWQKTPFLIYEILLNDTVTPEGLFIDIQPPAFAYAEVTKPNLITLYVIPNYVQQSLNVSLLYTGPGVIKRGVVIIKTGPIPQARLTEYTPLVKAFYYNIELTQPQPLIKLRITNIKNPVAIYIETEVAVTPRDPLWPITIYTVTFINKSGFLTSITPLLQNSTNPGIYKGYPNGTLRLKWIVPTPLGDCQEVIVVIYGDNIAKFEIKSGRARVLASTQTETKISPPTQDVTTIVVIIAIITVALLIIREVKRK